MRTRIVLSFAILQLVASIAGACPWCDYSPNNFGFCRYYSPSGPYSCREYVADPFTGRTECATCGSCSWSDPKSNIPCEVGGGDEDGPFYPVASLHNLSWVGRSIDRVVVF